MAALQPKELEGKGDGAGIQSSSLFFPFSLTSMGYGTSSYTYRKIDEPMVQWAVETTAVLELS